MVERLHASHGELPVVGDLGLGVHHVPVLGDRGIVELQDEPGVDDGLVFLAHRVGAREQELLVGLVIPIRNTRGAAGRDRGHEALLDAGGLQRRLEVGDVGLDSRVARIGQRAHAHGPECGAGSGRDTRVRIGIGRGEFQTIPTISKARQHDFARAGPPRRHVVQPRGAELEPTQALERIAPPRPVVHLVPHRLPELAVAGDGDAGLLLQAHDLGDARAQLVLETTLVGRHARFPGTIRVDQVLGARQASSVARQDLIRVLPHEASSVVCGASVIGVYSIRGADAPDGAAM